MTQDARGWSLGASLAAVVVGSVLAVVAVYASAAATMMMLMGLHGGSSGLAPSAMGNVFATILIVGCALAGLVAGWLARVHGAAHGASAGLAGSIAMMKVYPPGVSPALWMVIASPVLICVMAGVVGRWLRARWTRLPAGGTERI